MAKEKYGFTSDYKYVVGIYDRYKGTLKFVDSVDYSDKSATWAKGQHAKAMTKEQAIQLQMGLLCNGTLAMVIEVPDFIHEDLVNVEAIYGTFN